MSVDYSNMTMYGKEFDDFEDAMNHLLCLKEITVGECLVACEDQEYNDPDELLTWEVYSYYSGGAGVLGIETSAHLLYTKPRDCATLFASVDGKLGEGCEIHEFVQVY